MKFDQALQLMKKGDKMKLPSWGGYWRWDNEKKTVMMHMRDGEVMDIRDTQRVEYTLKNVASDEWIPAYEGNCTVLGGTSSFGFDTALKYLKRGFGLRRESWNENICIKAAEAQSWEYSNVSRPDLNRIEVGPFIAQTNGTRSVPWNASQEDVFATDWTFAEEEKEGKHGKN